MNKQRPRQGRIEVSDNVRYRVHGLAQHPDYRDYTHSDGGRPDLKKIADRMNEIASHEEGVVFTPCLVSRVLGSREPTTVATTLAYFS